VTTTLTIVIRFAPDGTTVVELTIEPP